MQKKVLNTVKFYPFQRLIHNKLLQKILILSYKFYAKFLCTNFKFMMFLMHTEETENSYMQPTKHSSYPQSPAFPQLCTQTLNVSSQTELASLCPFFLLKSRFLNLWYPNLYTVYLNMSLATLSIVPIRYPFFM